MNNNITAYLDLEVINTKTVSINNNLRIVIVFVVDGVHSLIETQKQIHLVLPIVVEPTNPLRDKVTSRTTIFG